MPGDWDTLGGRLRWSVRQGPRDGRKHGLRYFQKLMERRAAELHQEEGYQLTGVALSSMQTYLPTDDRPALAEPSYRFVVEAARILGVRVAWLASGEGAPTEEGEAHRRENSEEELYRISMAVYEAMGVTTRVQEGDTEGGDRARFWGSALWAPIVRQTALRLYQSRPAWALLKGEPTGSPEGRTESDEAFEAAISDTAAAIASPLKDLGVDGAGLDLTEVADYVSATALNLQRVIFGYLPEGGNTAGKGEQ